MDDIFVIGLRADWLILVLWWAWGLIGVKRAVRTEPAWKQGLLYWLPLIVACGLLRSGGGFGSGLLGQQILPHTTPVFGAAFGLTTLGLLLACWSRAVLGRNWSSVVQVKQDHELVERGPYARVRHPIYTGLLLMFAGSAVMIGEARGVLAVLIVFVSFWRKLRLEEAWLEAAFGPRYADYRRRTRALVPGLF